VRAYSNLPDRGFARTEFERTPRRSRDVLQVGVASERLGEGLLEPS
jgi:hypothetical protein